MSFWFAQIPAWNKKDWSKDWKKPEMEQPKKVVLDVTEEPVAVESEEERPEPAFEPASGPSQISPRQLSPTPRQP